MKEMFGGFNGRLSTSEQFQIQDCEQKEKKIIQAITGYNANNHRHSQVTKDRARIYSFYTPFTHSRRI